MQEQDSRSFHNLSAVATVLSAVTATTMQFSYELDRGSSLAAAVNSFWFASLVFSIAAAVNSLLGLTWKQAM
jgi:WD repeat-containing protein 26